MAAIHGRGSGVYFDGTDMSGFLHSVDAATEVENADKSTFASDGWRENEAGMAGTTYTMDGYADVNLPLPDALGVDGGVLTWAVGRRTTVGDPAELAVITTTALGKAPSLDAMTALSWGLIASGPIGWGYLLHPLAEDTNTTTGSARDDGAQTATGAMAHLHVTAVDGGSWVITIEDSANGSSGWATVLTFAAKTAAGAERVMTAAVDTVIRRYVRVVATRTGGSVGNGITYALGFARNRS
jgi:hypothetical protein